MNGHEIDYKQIGERIKARRKELGYTQDDLSQSTGISKATIINYERGNQKSGGSIDIYVKLAKKLNLSLNWLFDIYVDTNTPEEDRRKFQIIQDFIDTFDPFIEVEYIDQWHAYAKLTIQNMELSYYIQEYYNLIGEISSFALSEDFDKIAPLLEKNFSETVTNKMTFSYGYLDFKNQNTTLEAFKDSYGKPIIMKTLQVLKDKHLADSQADNPTDAPEVSENND